LIFKIFKHKLWYLILLIQIVTTLSIAVAQADSSVKYYALIICGSRGGSFQNNTDYMYHLVRDHCSFDDVYYLSVDLSHPGVNALSTKANVRWAITNWLASRSDDNDIILIYFSSHGGGYNWRHRSVEFGRIDLNGDEGLEVRESNITEVINESGRFLYPNGFDVNGDGDTDDWVGIDECLQVADGLYWDDELASDLSTLRYGKLIFIRQGCKEKIGCFGGGIIDDISAPNRIIITATNETWYSYGDIDGDGFSEWSEAFIDALHGSSTHYNNGMINDGIVTADKNGDGKVSLKEAWDYAWNHDTARLGGWETPWLDDNGNGLPTFVNEKDHLDSSDGSVADIIFLPFRSGLVNRSIADGLCWLRFHQNPDGSWCYTYPDGTKVESVGVTAMAVMAFLNYGISEEDSTVAKGLKYILSHQNADGAITSSIHTHIYDTSLAVLALLATNNESYKGVVQKAVSYLIQAQQDEGEGASQSDWFYGGWGYETGETHWADLSNTQFVLLALHEADQKGWANVPDDVWQKALIFVTRCQNLKQTNPDYAKYDDGGFFYNPIMNPWVPGGDMKSYGSMTAAGLWSLICCGLDENDIRVQKAIEWFKNNYHIDQNYPIDDTWLYYYLYTFAKAMTLSGIEQLGDHDWYHDLSNYLVNQQRADGSWLNPWEGMYHGAEKEELATVQAILALETKISPIVSRTIEFKVESPVDLHVYDPLGRHVGLNYDTGKIEIEIPGATYTGPNTEPQIIRIKNPIAGEYKVVLVGRENGYYTLTISGYLDGNVVYEKSYTKSIVKGETQEAKTIVSAIAGAITISSTSPATTTTAIVPAPEFSAIVFPIVTTIGVTWYLIRKKKIY